MIATSDVYCILHDACKRFGISEIYDGHNTPTGEVKSERIVIRVGSQGNGDIWEKSFVNINFCVPDLFSGDANTVRLGEIERLAKEFFKHGDTGCFDASNYSYENGGDNWLSVEADTELRCHYVNVRILFQVLNVD